MESRLAKVLIEFYKEDPKAFEDELDLSFEPEGVGQQFVDFLQLELRKMTSRISGGMNIVAWDTWDLMGLLTDLLDSTEMYEEELEEIGQAILDSRK